MSHKDNNNFRFPCTVTENIKPIFMNNTFFTVCMAWKADKRPWVKPATYATYNILINSHLAPYFGPIPPSDLSEQNVQAYVNAELEKGLSVKTIRDSLRVLKMILRFGARRGEWTLSDFSVRFPVSCERRRPLQVLTKHHCTLLQRFLETHPSPRNMGLLICLNSGLRIGEVCGLQWGDIDLRTGLVHIRRTVQHIWIRDGDVRADWMEIGMPKTATSVRDIPLSREIQELLRPAKKASKPGHYVVTGSSEPLEPRYLRAYFYRLLAVLGIPKVRFHALRHSFATRCIEGRCDYKTVSAILGHSSISTTLDLYVHPGTAQKRRVIEKMSRSLR